MARLQPATDIAPPDAVHRMHLARSQPDWRSTMNFRTSVAAALVAASLIALQGCAVTRGQETVGAYVDDSAITTAVKARFVENKEVDASAISVETLKGTVMLSGFAKSNTERNTAEALAMKVSGVKSVRNEIAVRP
jgi:hyperosmotically inducible periplasmic protein